MSEEKVRLIHDKKDFTLLGATDVNDNNAHQTGGINVEPYSKFNLYVDLAAETLAPTRLDIRVQFSYDNATWFNLADGPFGSPLGYVPANCPIQDCQQGDCVALWLRVEYQGVGCDGSNYFTITTLHVTVMT